MEQQEQLECKLNRIIMTSIWCAIFILEILEGVIYFLQNRYNSGIFETIDRQNYVNFYILFPFLLHIVIGAIIYAVYKHGKSTPFKSVRLMQLLFIVYLCIDVVRLHHDTTIIYGILLIPIFLSHLLERPFYVYIISTIEVAYICVVTFLFGGKGTLSIVEVVILIVSIIFGALLTHLAMKRSYTIQETAINSSNKYRKLFSNLPIGFAQAEMKNTYGDINYKIVEFNQKFCEYFDLQPEDFLGINLKQGDKEIMLNIHNWFEAYSNALVKNGELLNVEIIMENTDKVFSTMMYTDDMNRINMILTDITEQKETQTRLSQAMEDANAAYRTQSEFLANMSHEIRTPINGILGMLQLTLKADDLQADYRDNLETAKNCADTLLRLINDILDFTKLEVGKYKIRLEPFDLRETIENTVALHKTLAENKGLKLDCQLPTRMPKQLNGDAQRVEQVLNCLLSNAVKFTTQGGVRVKVALIEESESICRVRLAVADSGIGIAEKDKPKLFKRFSQVDSSNTRKYGGTGLGLVITKQIVELMGGNISVQSKEGIGSTFIVEIPMEVIQEAEPEVIPEVTPLYGVNGQRATRVLIAEDEPINQQVVGKLLGMAGYSYEIAENGEKAVELFGKKHFDVALFDIQMPVMDGIEATRRIREIEKAENREERLPIIAVTARAMLGDKEKILEAQLDDYLAKPYNLDELMAVVVKHTKKKQEDE